MACGDTLTANTYKGPLFYILAQKRDFTRAKEYLDAYENHSLINEDALQKSDNYKLLYIYKGLFYQYKENSDSALFYYYKAINTSHASNNKTLAYHGLYQTYDMLHIPDSVSKYSILYAETNDETTKLALSSSLLSMQHLYNYHHYELLAEQKTLESKRARQKVVILSLCLLLIIVISSSAIYITHYRQRIKHQRLYAEYTSAIHNYITTKKELQNLKSQETINEQLVKQAKEDLDYFRNSMIAAQQKFSDIDKWGLEDALENTSIVELLKKKGDKGISATEHELQQLRRTFRLYLPGFDETMYAQYSKLSMKELSICMLIKLNFAPYGICSLMQIRSSALSNIRKRLLLKMFNIDGSSTLFDEKIKEFPQQKESVTF